MSTVLRPRLEQLIASFNRGNLDVPDGWLTPQTTFSLNGRPYESLLGRSADDPLIRLLTRGTAAYRSAATVLRYALQAAVITLEAVSEDGGPPIVAAIRVAGRLRDSNEPFEFHGSLRLREDGPRLAALDAAAPDAVLERLAKARV